MRSTQQVIKTFAIALAILIIGGIATAVFGTLMVVGDVVGLWQEDSHETTTENNFDYSNDTTRLNVDVKFAKLNIVGGDDFVVRSNSEHVIYSARGDRLYVTERDHNIFGSSRDTEVTIYVPVGKPLESLEVKNGAGSVYIDGLEVREAYFDFGAGKAELHNMIVHQDTRINCGAGMTEITNGSLYNLDLDMGAGKVILDGKLLGKAKIDAGVGALELNLLGSAEDYFVSVERGIGSVKINGEEQGGETVTFGSGPQLIYVDGGVGSIKVETRAE